MAIRFAIHVKTDVQGMLELIRDWILPGAPRSLASVKSPYANYDANHRGTQKYKRKQSLVKSIWIATGLIMLTFPMLPLIVSLGLITTFLSFMILDETP